MNGAKEPVSVSAVLPIECAVLGGAFQAAGDDLVDVDFRDSAVLGGMVFEVLGHCCGAEGCARKPADTLEGEDRVEGVG